MPADPGKDLGSQKLPTKKGDIGHVAPSFEDAPLFNSLAIRPTYRISLKLGDIENLFPWKKDSKAGRLARLQVLGLFYWPLNHRVAAGTTAKPANPARLADNGAAYDFIWDHFKQKFCGGGGDGAADTEIENRLKTWVVQKFDGGGHAAGGELPVAVETDTIGSPTQAGSLADGNFAKIRVPGGWTFLHHDARHNHNLDASVNGMQMYDSKYDFEKDCYEANPGLGKIPLIAKVEKLDSTNNEWVNAGKDVTVYFQLQYPYDLPDYIAGADRLNNQPNRPSLRERAYSSTHPNPPTRADLSGPGYFDHIWKQYQVTGDDPQATNCHRDCGGKRGNAVGGNDVSEHIFMLGEVDGFSKVHGNPPANVDAEGEGARAIDPEPSYRTIEAAGNAHPHAVKTLTNDDGEAGVVFMPSRCGGDRFRIRAYAVPKDMADEPGNDGKGMAAIRVDTGTFVVWRNIRISRWVRQPATEAGLNNVIVNQLEGRADNAAVGANDKVNRMQMYGIANNAGNWVGLPNYDMATVSDGQVGSAFDGFRAAMARSFCEFETEPGFAVEDLTAAEWNAAIDCGLDDIKQVGLPAANATIRAAFGPPDNRIDRTVLREADGITVNNGFCLPIRCRAAFNAATGTTLLDNTPGGNSNFRALSSFFWTYLIPGFMRHIAKQGYLPGLTFVQAVHTATILGTWSGLATHYHGAYISIGGTRYPSTIADTTAPICFGYSFTANATHELGHLVFSIHAPGSNDHNSCAGGVRFGGNDYTEVHDCHDLLVDNANNITNANFPAGHANEGEPRGCPAYGTCLMSYRRCEGQFCSRCVAQLRGWNNRSAQMRAGDTPLPPKFANVQTQWVAEGQQLTVNLSAQAMHGRALSFNATNPPAGGNLVDNGNGTAVFTWTPAAGTAGIYGISFQVTEAGDASAAPPIAANSATMVAMVYVTL